METGGSKTHPKLLSGSKSAHSGRDYSQSNAFPHDPQQDRVLEIWMPFNVLCHSLKQRLTAGIIIRVNQQPIRHNSPITWRINVAPISCFPWVFPCLVNLHNVWSAAGQPDGRVDWLTLSHVTRHTTSHDVAPWRHNVTWRHGVFEGISGEIIDKEGTTQEGRLCSGVFIIEWIYFS